jgi:large repetitive protein
VNEASSDLAGACLAVAGDAGDADATSGPSALDFGLVARFPFDEGVGNVARDASGNGRDAVLESGATWAPGIFGSAIACNGAGGRATTTVPGFGRSNVSGFAWVQSQDTTGPQSRVLGLGFETGYLWLSFGAKTPLVEGHDGVAYWNTASPSVTSDAGPIIGDGAFHHIGFVVDRAKPEIRVYVDGVVTARATPTDASGAFGTAGAPYTLAVGAQNATTGLSLDGVIDEVRVYGRAVSDAEIRELARK